MRDYGAKISCPICGHLHYITPKQLQADLEITYTCSNCGTEVMHANAVAAAIAEQFDTIRKGLGKIRV
jgi:DNA-directed RNA polymerase subunit RPC12/RpoP